MGGHSITSRGLITPKKRMALAVAMAAALYLLLYVASVIPYSEEELRTFKKLGEEILERRFTVLDIFINNFMISLMIFVPFIGPLIGGYVIYTTGRVIGAVAVSSGLPSIFLISLTIFAVYGLLEFLAYGLAFTQSLTLAYGMVKRRLGTEYPWLLVSVAGVALLLLAAAAIEYLLIELLKPMATALETPKIRAGPLV